MSKYIVLALVHVFFAVSAHATQSPLECTKFYSRCIERANWDPRQMSACDRCYEACGQPGIVVRMTERGCTIYVIVDESETF